MHPLQKTSGQTEERSEEEQPKRPRTDQYLHETNTGKGTAQFGFQTSARSFFRTEQRQEGQDQHQTEQVAGDPRTRAADFEFAGYPVRRKQETVEAAAEGFRQFDAC